MSDAYENPISEKPKDQNPNKPGIQKKPAKKKPQDRTPEEKKADQAKKAQKKQAAKIYESLTTGGKVAGAPFNEEFIAAALEQGLTPQQVKAIINSGALGGVTTTESFSSTELLDFFTENPDNIGALLEAVKANADLGYDNYAEYLAQGGEVGGYQSPNQLLQAAVFGIEGAKDAYVAGTNYAKYVAEGNDPRRWYIDKWEWAEESGAVQMGPGGPGGNAAPTGPSFIGGFDVMGPDDINQMGTVLNDFLMSRQQKLVAQQSFNEPFDLSEEAE